MKGSEELKGYAPEYIDSLKIPLPKFYLFTLGVAISGIEGISDLKPLLLVNKIKKPFISSDAPVVKNNYFRMKQGDLTGFQSPGLQISCPLNESLILLLLHNEAYKVFGECNSIVEITNENDVDSLNKMQILNALSILFIDSNEEEYVRRIHVANLSAKIEKHFVEKTVKTTPTLDGRREDIVLIHTEGIYYRIHFSFLKMDHHYNRRFKRRYKLTRRHSPVVLPYRNKELNDRMKYRFDQLIEKGDKTNTKADHD